MSCGTRRGRRHACRRRRNFSSESMIDRVGLLRFSLTALSPCVTVLSMPKNSRRNGNDDDDEPVPRKSKKRRRSEEDAPSEKKAPSPWWVLVILIQPIGV